MIEEGGEVGRDAGLGSVTSWLDPAITIDRPRSRPRVRRVAKVSEVLAREMVEHIFSQKLGPGTKLPSEALMLKEYGVGRASLREALHILEAYGLISIRPGKGGGPVIEDIGPQDFARLMTFYLHVKQVTFGELLASSQLLRVLMAAHAASRADPAQIAGMREALTRADASKDNEELGRALNEFYHAMYAVPGGEVLGMIRDGLYEIVMLHARRRIPFEQIRENLDDLTPLVDAIAAGEVAVAQALMQAHFDKTRVIYEAAVPGMFAEPIPWV